MKEIVDKVKVASVKSLTRLSLSALENATLQIEAQAMNFTNVQLPPIREESAAVAERFMENLNEYFDALTTLRIKESDVSEYGDLSLVDHDYLEAIIAMEGMVNHARNCDIQEYISFTTRLDKLFPNLRIDETNNPLDPEQIGDCFNEAIRPLGLKAHYLLTIYREFNKAVFHNLEEVLTEANDVLINLGILPKLDIKARNKELQKAKRAANRPTTDRETRAFSEENMPEPKPSEKSNSEMFAMMQTLVTGMAEDESTSDTTTSSIATQTNVADALPISEDSVEKKADKQEITEKEITGEPVASEAKTLNPQQESLMEMLTNIQSTLAAQSAANSEESTSDNVPNVRDTIRQSIKEEKQQGKIESIDKASSDVINLVTLLFEAIWKDDSLPIIMKELIGRTQIPIMKIALTDTSFFNDDQHPGRVILNEFAMAGIAWTEGTELEDDPIFTKIRSLVERLIGEPEISSNYVQGLINELRDHKDKHSETDTYLEQRLREAEDHSDRMDDVDEFVSQKINERVLRDDLDPSIRSLLDNQLHDFLVTLVLKEGPGGSSWKPVMSTIDVLLWTVQKEKQPGDKEKFDKINPRLLENLSKGLEIGGTSKTKITKIMRQLKQVQEYGFHTASLATTNSSNPVSAKQEKNTTSNNAPKRQRKEPPPLPRDDPHLRQVDKLPIGIWLEFKGAAGHPVRCTLAAKIDSIDKLFFVNRQGVKVVELTQMRLARELKAGSVKIVSDGSLVDRAMESVISNLRDSTPKKTAAA